MARVTLWVKDEDPDRAYLTTLLLKTCEEDPDDVPTEFRTFASDGSDDQLTIRVVPNAKKGGCDVEFVLPDTRSTSNKPIGEMRQFVGHESAVTIVAFSPHHSQIISFDANGEMRTWDPSTGELVEVSNLPPEAGSIIEYRPISGHVLSRDGRTMHVWAIPDWRWLGSFQSFDSGESSCACLSVDGKSVLVGGGDNRGLGDFALRRWTVVTQHVALLKGHRTWVKAVAVSPDGKHAASGDSDGVVGFWNLGSNAGRTFNAHVSRINSVAFLPDRHTLATGGVDGKLILWDVAPRFFGLAAPSFRRVATFAHENEVFRIAPSPDGKRIVTSSWKKIPGAPDAKFRVGPSVKREKRVGQIHVWNVEDDVEECCFTVEELGNGTFGFSGDGRFLLSGGVDKTVRMWRLPRG